MPNLNLIQLKQIDPSLKDFIKTATSGDISNAIGNFSLTGYHGPNVLYTSGGTQTILGQKTFNLSPNIPYSGGNNQPVSKLYISDTINAIQSSFTNILHNTGNESAQGIKTFDSVVINQGISGTSANFSNSVLVPTIGFGSVNNNSAINLDFFYNQNIIFNSGSQIIEGRKQFNLSPILTNYATGINEPVRFDQFIESGNWLQTQISALPSSNGSGFGGVSSFNAQSGNIFVFGRGGISVIQRGPITFISGHEPIITGSGVYLIQGDRGEMGYSLTPRGGWATARTYAYLDLVNLSGHSYVSASGHLSTVNNQPGTGAFDTPWRLLASGGARGATGVIGPTGAWRPRGVFNTETIYIANDAVEYIGSTYGFSGISGSGVLPTTGTNWYVIAKSGTQGLQGPSAAIFNWKGVWLNTGNYISGDSIYYSGSSFAVLTGTSGTIPSTGNPWFLISSGSTGPIGPQGIQGVPGPIGTFINSGIITGNFLSFSFYQDFFYTGLSLFETFVPRDFSITGCIIACVNSGRGPLLLDSGFSGVPIFTPMTGNFYQRDASNNKTFLGGFSFDSGIIYQNTPINAVVYNCPTRIGIDIFSGLSGISRITYGIFGL